MKSLTNQALYKLDFYKEQLSLFHGKNPSISTKTSRCLSLLIILILIIFTTLEYINYEIPLSCNYVFEYSVEGYPMQINNNNFTIAIGITINGVLMDPSHSLFSFNLYTLSNMNPTMNLTMGPCNETINNATIINTVCPIEDFDLTIQGEYNIFLSSFYQYLVLDIGPCQNTSYITCSPNASRVDEIIAENEVTLYLFSTVQNINNTNYEQPFYTQIYLQPFRMINNHITQQIYYDSYLMKTSGFFYFQDFKNYGYALGDGMSDSSSITFRNPTDPYFTTVFRTSTYQWAYVRQYLTFTMFLEYVGGFMFSFVLLFNIFAYFFVNRQVKLTIWNSAFKKKKKLKKKPNPKKKIIDEDQAYESLESNSSEKSDNIGNYLTGREASSHEEDNDKKKCCNLLLKEREQTHNKLKYTEDALEITRLIELKMNLNKMINVLFDEHQQAFIKYKEDHYLGNHHLDEIKSFEKHLDYAENPFDDEIKVHLSEEAVQELKNIDSNVDILKIESFMGCYKYYLEMSNTDGLDARLLKLLDGECLKSLEELKKKTKGVYDQKVVEQVIIDSISETKE